MSYGVYYGWVIVAVSSEGFDTGVCMVVAGSVVHLLI